MSQTTPSMGAHAPTPAAPNPSAAPAVPTVPAVPMGAPPGNTPARADGAAAPSLTAARSAAPSSGPAAPGTDGPSPRPTGPPSGGRWTEALLSAAARQAQPLIAACARVGLSLAPDTSAEDAARTAVVGNRAQEVMAILLGAPSAPVSAVPTAAPAPVTPDEAPRQAWMNYFASSAPPQRLREVAAELGLQARGTLEETLWSLAHPAFCQRADVLLRAPAPADPALTLVDRLLEELTPSELFFAAREYDLRVSGNAAPRELASAIVRAGYGPAVLEQALDTDDQVSAFSRGGVVDLGGPGENPSVSATAREGPTAPSQRSTPRGQSGDPTIAALFERIAALERSAAQAASESLHRRAHEVGLSGPWRTRLLSPTATRPSQHVLERLSHVARDNESSVVDLGLHVPAYGPLVDSFFANNNAARYCGKELAWCLKHQVDMITIMYQAWATFSTVEPSLPEASKDALGPALAKFEQAWTFAHGRYQGILERMKALSRGVITREWQELPDVPRSLGMMPPELVSLDEVGKWKKAASASHSGALAGSKRPREVAAAPPAQRPMRKFSKNYAVRGEGPK